MTTTVAEQMEVNVGLENEEFETFGETQQEQEFEAVNVLAVQPAKKDNSDFYKGAAAGLLVGALAGAVAWLWERRTRLDLLKQLEISTFIAAGLAEGKNVTKYGKKEIKLSKDMMNNPATLIRTVMENIDKVKMNRKEKARWKNVVNNLVELTLIWDNKAKIETAKKAKLEESEVTETLVEK